MKDQCGHSAMAVDQEYYPKQLMDSNWVAACWVVVAVVDCWVVVAVDYYY